MVMVSSKHHSGREKRLQEKDKLPVRERYCIIPPLSFYIQLCQRALLVQNTVCTEEGTDNSRVKVSRNRPMCL